jgi:ESS family glutamate:Na+ symporter
MSILLLFGTMIRAKMKPVQRFLIPNSLIAGLFGLLLSGQVLNIIHFSWLENWVYHLLNLAFAALGLGTVKSKFSGDRRKDIISTGILMNFIPCIQLIVGLVITLLFIYTIFPDLFPLFGSLMAIGYGTGPGQAFAIGSSLENMGFNYGGKIGLIFGGMGFLCAFFVGILLIHWGIKNKETTLTEDIKDIPQDVWTGIITKKQKPSAGELVTSSEAIDSLTLQLALCGLVYFIAFTFVRGAVYLLTICGMGGIAETLWGFVFLVTAVVGVIVRYIMVKIGISYLIDQGSQRRISGVCVDYMVTAAIIAISLVVVASYAIPLVIIGTIGGLITVFLMLWLKDHIWSDYRFENLILCYATLTGTMSSGLALCRVVDPDFSSTAVENYMYGMWMLLILDMPALFIILNIFLAGYMNAPLLYYIIIIAIPVAFALGLFAMWKVFKIWK